MEQRLAHRIDRGLENVRAAVQSTISGVGQSIYRRLDGIQEEIKSEIDAVEKQIKLEIAVFSEAVTDLSERQTQDRKELEAQIEGICRLGKKPNGSGCPANGL